MPESEERTREFVSFHEAAHAVVGAALGAPPTEVTIESNAENGSDGHSVQAFVEPLANFGGEDWGLMVPAITSSLLKNHVLRASPGFSRFQIADTSYVQVVSRKMLSILCQ